MNARIKSSTLLGIDAVCVDVEAQLLSGLRRFALVGLPDGVVREAKDRVRCAIENSGLSFPRKELIVSLGPASLPKVGAQFDLAIALSILLAERQCRSQRSGRILFLGELALDGSLKPISGALAAADVLRQRGGGSLVLPVENAHHCPDVPRVELVPVRNLLEAIAWLEGRDYARAIVGRSVAEKQKETLSFSDVRGQESAKRTLEIAAAGGHNVLMVGPPGSGKSMLARRIASILPKLSSEEELEVNKIYSASKQSGSLAQDVPWQKERPFRSPHHSTSAAALIGGGSMPNPGEISLAHRGVLFLDELPELRRDVLESLREPLESKVVSISRAKMRVCFPADFMLVAAMNPCPCGRQAAKREGKRGNLCDCTPQQIARYRSRLSGPILDRIALSIWVPAVPYKTLKQKTVAEDSTEKMAKRVQCARARQYQRLGLSRVNASMSPNEVSEHCILKKSAGALVETAMERFALSARVYSNLLKVARSIADLEQQEEIDDEHVMEALTYRNVQLS